LGHTIVPASLVGAQAAEEVAVPQRLEHPAEVDEI
jgi:hypothetical protein